MPDQWLSIAAAAAQLNVHTRTIERRLAANKIQSRRADDGQVQVLINVPDMPLPPSTPVHDPLETVKELAQDQVSLATGSASAIVRLAQADAERARSELVLVRDEAARVRRGGRIAWGAVALMSAGVCVAVGWTTHQLTKADADIAELHRAAERTEQEAQKLLAERDAVRQEADDARLAAANANGRLTAYIEQAKLDAKRAKEADEVARSQNVLQRIAAAVAGD